MAEINGWPANQLDAVKWTPPRTTQTVDPCVVVNQLQAHNLLTAVTYIGKRGCGRRLAAMFACMYYAAMRPAEVVALRASDCHLSDKGWGSITLAKSRPEVNTHWTDSGQTHGERGLKHRADDDVRVAPILPILVKILQTHINEFGIAADGRLFSTERGQPVGSTAYTEVWQDARQFALTPEQVASSLAPTEIAKRAGHSVEVLLRVHAKCVHGQEEVANQCMEDLLTAGTPALPPKPSPQPPPTPDRQRISKPYRDDPASVSRLLANARASASRPQRER